MSGMSPNTDALKNYEFIEEIYRGNHSEVHVVSCRRGRMRGRLVVLKVSKHPPLFVNQSLCHPHVVSLYSVFAAPTEHFQVLEFCANKDLALFMRANGTLETAELRKVVLSLVSALTYLHKQRIVHRAIEPDHIFVTKDYQVKLGHFDQAIEIPFDTTELKEPCSGTVYSSPEIIYRRPYTYSTDLWSLGCLIVACTISTKLPEISDYSRTLKLRNAIPSTQPPECSDLVAKLLQSDTSRRISLSDVARHSFLSRSLPVSPLLAAGSEQPRVDSASPTSISRHIPSEQHKESESTTAQREGVLPGPYATPNSSRPKNSVGESSPPLAQRTTGSSRKQEDPVRPSTVERAAGTMDSESGIPMGTIRPQPFTACSLQPQTKKLAHGHIVILPSLAVLADFREGQRRAGLPGKQVLVISDDGLTVKVYNAPHLSTPCCLVEPAEMYTLSSLPSRYWEAYNDTCKTINEIKRKTPQLVLHSSTSKCTLMANSPNADIELLFDGTGLTSSKPNTNEDNISPSICIRLSRQSGSITFAQRVKGPQDEEWTKKKLLWSNRSIWLDSLSESEHRAFTQLLVFLRTCEAVEMTGGSASTLAIPGLDSETKVRPKTKPRPNSKANKENIPPGVNTEENLPTSSSSDLRSLRFRPRPRIVSASTTVKSPSGSVLPSLLKHTTDTSKSALKDKTSFNFNSIVANSMETRFLPGVGWCVQYALTASDSGRYRILFSDGISMDFDVHEERVEVKDATTGQTTRYTIGECHLEKDVGDRVRVFQEFVSMFDVSAGKILDRN